MFGKRALLIAGGLLPVFAAHVVIGKVAIVGGATTVPGPGDIGEFPVLFAAVVFLIAACLHRERTENQNKGE